MIRFPSSMNWLVQLFSRSKSVETEVLKRLPPDISFEFRADFDDQNNPVIFVCAPNYEVLITEGATFQEAVVNACDAILTYFNVPREYANHVEYRIKKKEDQRQLISDIAGLKQVVLSRHNPVCA